MKSRNSGFDALQVLEEIAKDAVVNELLRRAKYAQKINALLHAFKDRC